MSKNNIDLYIEAKHHYYNGNPIMSDAQFDALEESIREANPAEPALSKIGAPPKGPKIRHRIHMGSLEKVHSIEELIKWDELREGTGTQRFHVSLKADGGSVALYYSEGVLVRAVTRGDGRYGEDVTHHALKARGVPLRLARPLSVGVRCEAVMTAAQWAEADPEKESNPRNLANGILGRLDTIKSHLLTFLAFDWAFTPVELDQEFTAAVESDSIACDQERDRFEVLSTWSEGERQFIPIWQRSGVRLSEIGAIRANVHAQRVSGQIDYWIDGMVIRYEDLDLQHQLGMSDNRPKGQVALKFPAEAAETTLESVTWQVGHSGAITPVANVAPVRIGGTTVSRASLANAKNIETLGVTLGAKVRVSKQGDIIPMIVEVLENTPRRIPIPSQCPVCEGPVGNLDNTDGTKSAVLFCMGQDCDAQTVAKIRRFVESREILGLGYVFIQALVDSGLVASVPDLLRLTPTQLAELVINQEKGSKLGAKRSEAICGEIRAKTAEMTLAQFLGAFGTRGLGVRRAVLMQEACPELHTFERWFDGSLENPDFATKAGVPNLGGTILEGLRKREKEIREALELVTLIAPKQESKVAGSVFCITGVLPSGRKKKEYAGPLEAKGHKLVDDVRAGVDYLVCADPNGPESSKTKKAKKLGIRIIGEPELEAFV